MEFNSQVCTTMEQSERLIALGLKKDTADMVHYHSASMKLWGVLATPYGQECAEYAGTYRPAWSLHRLIVMLRESPSEVAHDIEVLVPLLHGDMFESCIIAIEHLIEKGCFNKEYLIR